MSTVVPFLIKKFQCFMRMRKNYINTMMSLTEMSFDYVSCLVRIRKSQMTFLGIGLAQNHSATFSCLFMFSTIPSSDEAACLITIGTTKLEKQTAKSMTQEQALQVFVIGDTFVQGCCIKYACAATEMISSLNYTLQQGGGDPHSSTACGGHTVKHFQRESASKKHSVVPQIMSSSIFHRMLQLSSVIPVSLGIDHLELDTKDAKATSKWNHI